MRHLGKYRNIFLANESFMHWFVPGGNTGVALKKYCKQGASHTLLHPPHWGGLGRYREIIRWDLSQCAASCKMLSTLAVPRRMHHESTRPLPTHPAQMPDNNMACAQTTVRQSPKEAQRVTQLPMRFPAELGLDCQYQRSCSEMSKELNMKFWNFNNGTIQPCWVHIILEVGNTLQIVQPSPGQTEKGPVITTIRKCDCHFRPQSSQSMLQTGQSNATLRCKRVTEECQQFAKLNCDLNANNSEKQKKKLEVINSGEYENCNCNCNCNPN